MTQVKKFKIKIKNKFYVKNITFKTFMTLTTQSKKIKSAFDFLTYVLKT